MGTYYLFFLPSLIEVHFQYDGDIQFYVKRSFLLIFFCNALVNPLTYAGMSRDFNACFRKLLHMQQKPGISMTGSNVYNVRV